MTFHMVDESVSAEDMEHGVAPPGTRILSGDRDKGGQVYKYGIYTRVMLSGDMLVDAHASYDQQTGEPVVAFRFNNTGARKFGEITSENVGKLFAIVLGHPLADFRRQRYHQWQFYHAIGQRSGLVASRWRFACAAQGYRGAFCGAKPWG
jgi:preprotein translocase subunit SecD